MTEQTPPDQVSAALALDNATILRLLDAHPALGPVEGARVFLLSYAHTSSFGRLFAGVLSSDAPRITSDDGARVAVAMTAAQAREVMASVKARPSFVDDCGAIMDPGVLRVVAFIDGTGQTTDAPLACLRSAPAPTPAEVEILRACAVAPSLSGGAMRDATSNPFRLDASPLG